MTEAAEMLSDWKATYGELFPHRNPDAMAYSDAQLALAVLMRRELRLNAPKPRARILYRFNRYNGISE